MSINIRMMTESDRPEVRTMMEVFYASPAVQSNGSSEIFEKDIDNCVNDSPFLEGYIFEEDGIIKGYAMIAKSFSTEFGKPCIWIEDIYVKDAFRGQGIATLFFNYIKEKYAGFLHRLEVERENEKALAVYEKCGFEELPYMEMKR